MTNYIKRAIIALCLCVTVFICNATEDLHLYAYNVGQANFNVLYRQGEVAIMDAGIGCVENEKRISITAVLDKIFTCNNNKISIFISHPHTDHFNMFERISSIFLQKENATFYLGGMENDWNTGNNTAKYKFFQKIQNNCRFLNAENLEKPFVKHDVNNIINGTTFSVFLMNTNKLTGNSLSQIVRVEDMLTTKSILFTGDANAETLHAIQAVNINATHTNNAINIDDEDNDPELSVSHIGYFLHWAQLNSDIIVCPHHGSTSNGSDIFANLLGLNKIAIINSDPSTKHHLPSTGMIQHIINKQNNISHNFSNYQDQKIRVQDKLKWDKYSNIIAMEYNSDTLEQSRIYLTSAGMLNNQCRLCYHFDFFYWGNIPHIGVYKDDMHISIIGSGHGTKKQPKLNIWDYPSKKIVDATNQSKVLQNVYNIYPGYRALNNTNIKKYLSNVTLEQKTYTDNIINSKKVSWHIQKNLIYKAHTARLLTDDKKKLKAIEAYLSFEKQEYVDWLGNTQIKVINSITGKADKLSKKASKFMQNKESINLQVLSEEKAGLWKQTYTEIQ